MTLWYHRNDLESYPKGIHKVTHRVLSKWLQSNLKLSQSTLKWHIDAPQVSPEYILNVPIVPLNWPSHSRVLPIRPLWTSKVTIKITPGVPSRDLQGTTKWETEYPQSIPRLLSWTLRTPKVSQGYPESYWRVLQNFGHHHKAVWTWRKQPYSWHLDLIGSS